jgi:hypothetical protein
MIAASIDNLIFLVLIGVAALFQLLSKAVSKQGKSDPNKPSSPKKPQTPRPIQRAPQESDAERIRKFLEALGQPPSSTPPPPVLPRADIPPRPLAPVQPPPVLKPAWALPVERQSKPDVTQRKSVPREQPSRLQQVVPPPPRVPAIPPFEIHETLPAELQETPISTMPVEGDAGPSQAVAKRGDFRLDIAMLLASKSSLREAILVREILGTPRGLQEFDLA